MSATHDRAGIFVSMSGQRGFTLVELIVAVGIIAMLAIGLALSLTLRPGALRGAVDGYDASIAAAQALAATTGNGATLVFAPRYGSHREPIPGFTLTIYRGRPNLTGAVAPANLVQLVSDADVHESTLGSPPFTIFLSTAAHPSGMAAYPKIERSGMPSFAVVAMQPPCPSDGFTLTFRTARASQTRRLACPIAAAGTPIPTPTMSPAAIILTPASLVFEYPSAPRQHFVATEWGYPRWFAASAWTCGNGIAAFPQRSPNVPYTPPATPADESASPLPPDDAPYSFANATESMEDAPAWFFLDPGVGGLCTTAIVDAFGQNAALAVRVMGALSAAPSTLSWPNPLQTRAQSVTLGKSYDSQPLAARITVNTCANIASVAWRAGSTPRSPGATPSTQILDVSPVLKGPRANRGGACAISVRSQYVGEPAVKVGVNVRGQLASWPAGVQYPVRGQALAKSGCGVNRARAFSVPFTIVDANDARFASFGAATDVNGCYDGALVAYEPDGSKQMFAITENTCGASLMLGSWLPVGASGQAVLSVSAATSPDSNCSLTIDDGAGAVATQNFGLVAAQIRDSGGGACGAGVTVAVGGTCSFSLPEGFDDSVCDPDAGMVGGVDTTYGAEIRFGSSAGSLSGQPPDYTFTRTAAGPVSIYQREVQTTYYLQASPSGPVCKMHSAATLTLLFALN